MSGQPQLEGEPLTTAISAAIVKLYRDFYGHDRATASTYINDNVVVCLLEDILTTDEAKLVANGERRGVLDGRIAFQESAQDAFTAVVEELVGRRVLAFLSGNQTSPGVACELFFLEPQP